MKSLTPLTRFIAAALLLAFSLAACSRDAGTRFTSLTETSDVSDLVSAPSTTDPGWAVDLPRKLYANLTLPTVSVPPRDPGRFHQGGDSWNDDPGVAESRYRFGALGQDSGVGPCRLHQ